MLFAISSDTCRWHQVTTLIIQLFSNQRQLAFAGSSVKAGVCNAASCDGRVPAHRNSSNARGVAR